MPTLIDLSKRATANWLLTLNVLQLEVILVRQVGPQVQHIDLLLGHASDPDKIDFDSFCTDINERPAQR